MVEQQPIGAMDASTRTPSAQEVLDAASAIVEAFAATDRDRYFAAFAPEATFVFHTEPDRIGNRAEYERLWSTWLGSGWRVLECKSSNPLAQPFPGGAVFSHDVFTRVDAGGAEDAYRERETIVFRVDGDRLVAVHEHLSPTPTA